MKTAALALARPFEMPPVNVNFTVDGPNHVGVEQHPCKLCGDCVTGCNYSAKNTLLMNYLPDAKTHGAHIFTEIEVRSLERSNDRWILHVRDRRPNVKRLEPLQDITADIVILGAGSLGSTEILARSQRDHALVLSAQLGKGFTGNGDVLGFGICTEPEIRGIGLGPRRPADEPPVGPTILTVIDATQTQNVDDGIIVEEGVIPGALLNFWGQRLTLQNARESAIADVAATPGAVAPVEELARIDKLIQKTDSLAWFGGDKDHVITFLGMAHDEAAGTLVLADDRLRVHWPGARQQPVFARVKKLLREATAALKGIYMSNPIEHVQFTNTTVHPLGGCVMADDAEHGVVNDHCEVYDSISGTTVHPGLYVCDGAVIPRPLGVNPLMTISAVAERTVSLLAKKNGWHIPYQFDPRPQPPGSIRPVGIRFTETMQGIFIRNGPAGFPSWNSDRWDNTTPFEFTLQVVWDDLERLLNDGAYPGSLTGKITAPGVDSQSLNVDGGTLKLFVRDPQRVNTRQMQYEMEASANLRQWFVTGFKEIHNDPGVDAWADTTTLFVTVYDGPSRQAKILGWAVLRVLAPDFVHQVSTIEVLNAPSGGARRDAKSKFVRFFLGSLFDVYGGLFGRPVLSNPGDQRPPARQLQLGKCDEHWIVTSDGTEILLTRYYGGPKGPVIAAPGFGTSTRAFLTDTIDQNFAEFLFANKYDVWLLDYRGSGKLRQRPTQFTIDDIALRDFPAAVGRVLEVTGKPGVDVVGHCVGSVALLMSLLRGVLEGVRAAVCSQFSVHINQPGFQQFKAGIHLADIVDSLGIRYMTPSVNSETFHSIDELLDGILRLYPTHEQCDSPVCRRILFMYGEVFRHEQLNDLTHVAIHEMFGLANMKTFRHLSNFVRAGVALDYAGNDLYLPNVKRLRDVRIALIQGRQNGMFMPKGTERTFKWLCDNNGPANYSRRVIDGYGHMDCFIGRSAAHDVFPVILQELER
jgi:cholesterol oxidase